MAQARLLSITAVLTALIWVSADSLVTETILVDATLEPVPAAGANQMIVAVADGGQRFELQITGPRKAVDDIAREAPLRLRLRVPDLPTGENELRLERSVVKEQLVEQYKPFGKVTLVSVRPPTATLMVDRWIGEEVDLTLSRLTLAYDVEPQLQPRTISVRMRESRRRALGPDPLQLDVTTDVERLLREAPAGESVNVTLALGAPGFGADAIFTPKTATVTATVKAQRATARIPTVPVLVAVSFANLEKPVRPVLRDGTTLVTQTITVTGPTDEVNRLLSGRSRAFGLIHLKQSDLEALDQWKVTNAEYHLPPGVRLAEEPPPIEYKLIEVSDAE